MRHVYADFIDQVAKPARYLGGEYQQVVKDPAEVDARVCLAFPDVYEIGMSHLGTKILYSLLNKHPRIAAERSFTPWVDMEAELRKRELPLVALESFDPLSSFDVIGFSLQYEMTYSNVLTMLDLGGVPLRAEDRADDAPLVLGGGPNATHPEPVAPFFDAFFIGEAEEVLPALLLEWSAMRRSMKDTGQSRLDALAELAARFPLYVPALYEAVVDTDTGFVVVGAPKDHRAPSFVNRAVVENIDDYPFPSDTPVPYAEAVFDRASVEIARGCTEGCRFCQAGMIYRPVRERSPESIAKSLIDGVEQAGYDETGLTCLSTADYSSITPLVKDLMGKLRDRKVSLSVSSLRAYGLNEDLLDELASVRATGLTFAPEAGTQRMRDVVNKNITEEHVAQSAHRVFARGWNRLKLYFMLGLPTETDEDIIGIADTGKRMWAIGRQHIGKRAEVTVSVSSHVPKPHTPFQWCAMDSLDEIRRKQRLLRDETRDSRVRLKTHPSGISYVEGIFARGDRRVGAALELAWRRGARFDGWDEHFDVDAWNEVFADLELPVDAFLGTIPVTARLPWDHIDVGLEDGFLLSEYRKAVKSRLSPPCGKPFGELIHHTNVAESQADGRKLVCYDCGVACDLTKMKEDRLVSLRSLKAYEPAVPKFDAEALAQARRDGDLEAARRIEEARKAVGGQVEDILNANKKRASVPRPAFTNEAKNYYRLRFTKLGRTAFLGHLDLARVLARLFRRADLPVAYSRGFHPKPIMAFGPALSLGVASMGELVDVAFEIDPPADELLRRIQEVTPEGIDFIGATRIYGEKKPSLGHDVQAYDLLVGPAPDGITYDGRRLERIARRALEADELLVDRDTKKRGPHQADIRPLVMDVSVVAGDAATRLNAALDWPDEALLRVRVAVTPTGSAKPVELARALGVWGKEDPTAPKARLARLGLLGLDADGAERDPIDVPAPVAPPVAKAEAEAPVYQ